MNDPLPIKHHVSTFIDFCFPDLPEDRHGCIEKFLDAWANKPADRIWASMCVEDENLVIDLSYGFHCLHIPIKAILHTLEKAKEDTDNLAD